MYHPISSTLAYLITDPWFKRLFVSGVLSAVDSFS